MAMLLSVPKQVFLVVLATLLPAGVATPAAKQDVALQTSKGLVRHGGKRGPHSAVLANVPRSMKFMAGIATDQDIHPDEAHEDSHDEHHDDHHDDHDEAGETHAREDIEKWEDVEFTPPPEPEHHEPHHESEPHVEHHEGPADRSAHCVAVGLIATVILVPLVLHMALSGGVIRTLTLKLVDTFVSIFVAILWFTVFSQAVETFRIHETIPMGVELICFLQVIVLYFIAIGVASYIKDREIAMATVCCVGAHYIAFAGMGAGGRLQESASDLVPESLGAVVSFGFCAVVIAVIMGFAALFHRIWIKDHKDKSLDHEVDEMECDIVGLVASFLITQAVRQAITGQYPPGHFFLQSPGHHHPEHTWWQRAFMLCWSICLTFVAGLALPRLNKMAGHDRLAKKGIHVAKVVLIMLVAWGYLLWGQWLFYEELFRGDVMFGHMVFALAVTLVALALLASFAAFLSRRHHRAQQAEEQQPTVDRTTTWAAIDDNIRSTNTIFVTGISLVVAWSWEHCFSLVFDIIGHEYSVGYGGLVPKIILATAIPAVLLPVYVIHLKPLVLEEEDSSDDEEEGAHQEKVSQRSADRGAAAA